MKEIKTAKPQDFDISKSNTKDTSDNSNKDNKEYNLIKKTAKELGMTYKELGEAIGVSDTTLASSVSTNKISAQIEASLRLLLENNRLKKELESLKSGDYIKDLENFNQLKNLLKIIAQ